ncbi:hypothetical protein [Actinomadura sp. J1-007]|uniref:hypothetical protein n=1 Tax=Actinomadura sp. J1-007 TaxID=2661913 RepID=UPI001F5024A3|nr:hypothetical protein [Actinomadura sp. J1-007]
MSSSAATSDARSSAAYAGTASSTTRRIWTCRYCSMDDSAIRTTSSRDVSGPEISSSSRPARIRRSRAARRILVTPWSISYSASSRSGSSSSRSRRSIAGRIFSASTSNWRQNRSHTSGHRSGPAPRTAAAEARTGSPAAGASGTCTLSATSAKPSASA